MKNSTQKVLLSEAQIDRRVEELAGEISAEYRGKKVLLVCVLKGAVVFASDLMRRLKVAVEIDFMAVSSYGSETASSGAVRILKDLDSSIRGKDLLIVEDIVDTGLTLDYICKNLLIRKPSSLKVVTLSINRPGGKLNLPQISVASRSPIILLSVMVWILTRITASCPASIFFSQGTRAEQVLSGGFRRAHLCCLWDNGMLE